MRDTQRRSAYPAVEVGGRVRFDCSGEDAEDEHQENMPFILFHNPFVGLSNAKELCMV